MGNSNPITPKLDDIVVEEFWSEGEDEDEEDDPDCPTITKSKEEFMAMCMPWKKSLIVKVLGNYGNRKDP